MKSLGTIGSFLSHFANLDGAVSQILVAIFGLFTIWMLVDAIRREEWLWAFFIFICPVLNAPLYFFLIYRQAGAFGAMRGFQLPGAQERSRIKELEAQIHHLDKAHHHLQLGDIYFQQGKLQKALECYSSALERDPQDQDIRAHLGQCLLRLQRPAEAQPLLEGICAENPKHDYGHSMMALAETQTALGNVEKAIQTWRAVLQDNGYARARVQLAELCLQQGEVATARTELREVIADDAYAPGFQRKREAIWVRRAKRLLKRMPT